MISNTNLSVRVCGIVVARLKMRREIQDGEYTGRNQMVFADPILGFMPLDDSLTIELKRLNVPFEERVWEPTDLRGLIARLHAAGAIPSF
jgi:hypothetical protein